MENTTSGTAVKGSASLEERLWRVESVLDIQRLEARYCHTWDAGDGGAWAALFTEDGTFRCVDLVGRPGFTRRGRTDLAAFCREFQAGMARQHLITTYDVQVAGDVAHGTTAFQCHRARLGADPHVGMLSGYYETEYVHTAGGWLIRGRVERLVFNREETYYTPVHPL